MYKIPEYGGMNLTQILMLFTLVFWVLYDILAYILWGRNFTLSVQMYLLAKKHMEISFLLGAVVAHWIWNIFPD